MAVLFDNADSGAEAATSATLTFSFTVGSGSNMVLCVLASQTTAQVNIDSATYNGTAMAADTQYTVGGIRNVRFFYLLNPTAGANSLVVNYASASSRPFVIVASWQGVESLENITNSTGSGTNLSHTISSASGNVVAALNRGSVSTTTMTWTSPAVERLDEAISTLSRAWVADEAGSTSVTIDGAFSATESWAGTAFNLNDASEPNQAAEFAGAFAASRMTKNIVVT